MTPTLDRRSRRTREALAEAFNHLVLHRRQRRIAVRDMVDQANVGRSTFHDHYSSADDLALEALSRPFAILADDAAGLGDAGRLARLLDHFWENRQRARDMLGRRSGERAARLLAAQVEERLAGAELSLPPRLAALQLAEAALGPLRGWLAGEASCHSTALAQGLCRADEPLRAALVR